MPFKCKSKSLIHKLHARELNGGFTKKLTVNAKDLYDRVPEEHILNLSQVFEDLGDHVFMGSTSCGKFLLTYSIKRTEYLHDFGPCALIYILHFWSFSRIPLQSKKVAEVHLFSGFSSEITTQLNITIAQWPTIHDKLIVYGETELNCPSTEDYHTSNTFLTVTHLPSLESCPQCEHIARMYRESNSGPYNNQCMKHGVTLDVMFMLAHPHPKLNVRNCKIPNRFLVNTGNFLHVISLELHQTDVPKTPCSTNNNNSEELARPILNAAQDYKVAHDLHRINPSFKFLHLEERAQKRNSSSFLVSKDKQENVIVRRFTAIKQNKEHDTPSDENIENVMAQAEKIYAFQEYEDGSELKFKCLKWFRKRKLADKMYEFDEIDDNEVETTRVNNILKELQNEYESSSKTSKVSFGRFIKIRQNPHIISQERTKKTQYSLREKDSTCDTMPNGNDVNAAQPRQTDTLQSELFLKTDSICSKPDSLDVSSIISDWESQDTASLSPKSDISNVSDFSSTSGPSSGIRFSLKLKKPRYNLKKFTCTQANAYPIDVDKRANKATFEKSLGVVLKPHKILHYSIDEIKSPPSKMNKRFAESNQNNVISGCCNDFEKSYVLNDKEENQVTVESEMDFSEDGNQVPIILRAPTQPNTFKLKFISDPSEETNSEFCSVKQRTLDIEQFCFKAADLICKKENYKFCSCNDYDVEIVSVCPISGDVMAAVSIRMNAAYCRLGSPFNKYSAPDCSNNFLPSIYDLRKEFDTCCILIWNVDSLVCRVEAYTPLQPLIRNVTATEWVNCTVEMAQDLRFQRIGNFNAPSLMPRFVDHQVMIEKNGEEVYNKPILELYDRSNLTGFRIDKKYFNQINEIDSDVNQDSPSIESDSEDGMSDLV